MCWLYACSHSYARAISRAITSRIRRHSDGSNIVVTCHETRQKIWLQAKGVYHLRPVYVNLSYTLRNEQKQFYENALMTLDSIAPRVPDAVNFHVGSFSAKGDSLAHGDRILRTELDLAWASME